MDRRLVRVRFEEAIDDDGSGATFLHRFLGIRVVVDGETATLEFDHQPHLSNRQGVLHGGILSLLLDTAMGNLHRVALGPGMTLEMKTQYLKSVTNGHVVCVARFIRAGSQVSFLRAEATCEGEGPVAVATATWLRIG